MAGLPKVTFGQVIREAERNVIAKAMEAVKRQLRVGKYDGSDAARLSALVDDSNQADLELQDACHLLAELTEQPLGEVR